MIYWSCFVSFTIESLAVTWLVIHEIEGMHSSSSLSLHFMGEVKDIWPSPFLTTLSAVLSMFVSRSFTSWFIAGMVAP